MMLFFPFSFDNSVFLCGKFSVTSYFGLDEPHWKSTVPHSSFELFVFRCTFCLNFSHESLWMADGVHLSVID